MVTDLFCGFEPVNSFKYVHAERQAIYYF